VIGYLLRVVIGSKRLIGPALFTLIWLVIVGFPPREVTVRQGRQERGLGPWIGRSVIATPACGQASTAAGHVQVAGCPMHGHHVVGHDIA
jgi:hypothetical protein